MLYKVSQWLERRLGNQKIPKRRLRKKEKSERQYEMISVKRQDFFIMIRIECIHCLKMDMFTVCFFF